MSDTRRKVDGSCMRKDIYAYKYQKRLASRPSPSCLSAKLRVRHFGLCNGFSLALRYPVSCVTIFTETPWDSEVTETFQFPLRILNATSP
jgi:hypothetical protein